MRRFQFVVWVAVFTATAASAQITRVTNMGEVIVVPDPSGAINSLVTDFGGGSIYPSVQEQFCRAAFNNMRADGNGDEYDGIFAFMVAPNSNPFGSVWQGSPVRSDATGMGRDNPVNLQVSKYNSTKIGQCAFLGSLASDELPSNPEDVWKPVGLFNSLTGIEMLGHEYGHHWLLNIQFDLNDGKGKRHLIRATPTSSGEGGEANSPNQHYSALADSRSVMYGSCITDQGGGSYKLGGCVRKYSHIDQYLMGLRAPDEVSPMMVLEDPSRPGEGEDAIAMSTGSSGTTRNGLTRYDVTAESIIRAMGPRVPAYPNAKSCFRVAFVVVLAPGATSIPPAILEKVQRYRNRWSDWFNFATDGRGTMDSHIGPGGCVVGYHPDGGTAVFDAGSPVENDAGAVDRDAGAPDAGEDAGEVVSPADSGAGPFDAGPCIKCDVGTIRAAGCGCGVASGAELFALLAVVALAAARRHAAPRSP